MLTDMRNLLILSLFLTFNTIAETLFEEYELLDTPDDTWTVHVDRYDDNDTETWARVNGKVMHGDKLRIRVLPDQCGVGNTITTFYTVQNNPEIEQQQGKVITATFKGIDIKVKILLVLDNPEFIGHMVYMDLGWLELEDIKTFFDGHDEVSLELKDDDDFKASDYFDITKNTWSLNRLNEALDLAEMKCKEFQL